MPSKYRIILEMASQTARDIASNADRYRFSDYGGKQLQVQL